MKKWGLAPVTGSLAPPPPYGSEQGSILLERGTKDGYTPSPHRGHSHSISGSPYHVRASDSNLNVQHGRSRSGNFRILPPTSPGPVRSPTDISLAQLVPNEENGETSNSAANQHHEEHVDENPLRLHLEDATNPPPDYASPAHSDSEEGGRRYSTDSEDNTPLIRVMNRSRGTSLVTTPAAQGQPSSHFDAPVPSYSDAILQGAGRATMVRSDSSESAESSNHMESDETPS